MLTTLAVRRDHLLAFATGVQLACVSFGVAHAQPATTSAAEAPRARNVILMISDGAGFNGWLAADYYEGRAGTQPYQVARPDGTRPYVGASAHYALRMFGPDGKVLDNDQWDAARGVEEQGYHPRDRWTRLEGAFANDFGKVALPYTSYTDSGAAGTALHTGRKTSPGRINLNWDGTEKFQTIAHIAHEQGRAAGAVTTVPVSHATPGSVWAQVPLRFSYDEIFRQMADGRLDVIMGAGHPFYDNNGRPSAAPQNRDPGAAAGRENAKPPIMKAGRQEEDYLEQYESGDWPPAEPPDGDFRSVGGRETWAALTSKEGLNGYAFIEAREDFEALAKAQTELPERLIGIFRSRSATQAFRLGLPEDPSTPSGMAFNPDVPDLATMSLAALNVLKQNPRGFFIMIEGGGVDWMGHANYMPRFIEEQMDFSAAVAAVIDWVETHSNWEETLLIVTSDHETGGIWGEGTFETESGILHPANPLDANSRAATQFVPGRDRFENFRVVQDRGPGRIPGHQFASGEHTNDLVPLWALGAGSTLFRQFERHDTFARTLWCEPYGWAGNYVDNTAVFHVMNAVFANEHRARKAAPSRATE
jgi:alkaline phosphatase